MIIFLKLISVIPLLLQSGAVGQEKSPFFEEGALSVSRSPKEPLPTCEFSGDPGNLTKACVYRERFFQEIHFRWETTFGCLSYTQSNLIKPNVTTRFSECIYPITSKRTPCFYMVNDPRCFPFDIRIPQTRQEIGRILVSEEAVNRWERCVKGAQLCCKEDDATHTLDEICPTVWDAWACWQKGVAGESYTQVCPEFAYTNSGPACHHMGSKECFTNGTWNKRTDYGSCSVKPRLVNRIIFHSSWLGVSALFCLPAIVILSVYRRLRERRFALHRNLLIALFLRNIFVIIIKSAVMIEEMTAIDGDTAMVRNGFGCKFLTSLEKLAAGAAFTCMLVDGLFLHRRIVAVFKAELNVKWVYPIATGATIIPVIIWICLMSTLNNSNCWLVYEVSNIQWVLDAPRLTMLFVNTILLVDILRIIFTKLRRQENDNQLSTAKATLFLMPLFGVQFLLTAWRPATTSCGLEQAYYFFTYAVDGLQGIMVSLLYCYLNKEVRELIRTTYRKTENVVSTRFRSEANRRRATQQDLDRRPTFSTMVADKPDDKDSPNNQDAMNKAIAYNNTQYEARLEPQHHVSNLEPLGSDSMLFRNDNSFNDLRFLDNDNPLDDEGFIHIGFEHDVENKNVQTVNEVLTIPDFKKKDDKNIVDYSFKYENIQTHNDADDKQGDSILLVNNIPTPTKRSFVFGGDKNAYENIIFKSEPENVVKIVFPQRFSQYSEIDSDTTLEVSDIRQIDDETETKTDHKNVDRNIAIEDFDEKEVKHNEEEKEKTGVDEETCEKDYHAVRNGAILLPDDIIENVDALEIFRASISDIVDVDQNGNVNVSKSRIPVIEAQYENVVMDANKLSPNRPDEKKVVFIDM